MREGSVRRPFGLFSQFQPLLFCGIEFGENCGQFPTQAGEFDMVAADGEVGHFQFKAVFYLGETLDFLFKILDEEPQGARGPCRWFL